MEIVSSPARHSRRLTLLAGACLAVWSVAFPALRAEAGSLVIPAWSFARGNGRIYANPDQYADAGPVVGSGPRQPWGWRVEYDIDIPVTAEYTFQICYAAAEARPVEIFIDDRYLPQKCCTRVTLAPASSEQPGVPTWNSSGAEWEALYKRNYYKHKRLHLLQLSLTKGKHTVVLARRRPLPHLVALRLDTPKDFPEGWKPPRYTVRDLENIPADYRAAFRSPSGFKVAAPPMADLPKEKPAGSLEIPAWTFDRGNARIYASPDRYAVGGPLVGGGPRPPGQGVVEYDIDFPVTADYTLAVRYAAAEARPTDVWLDDRHVGKACTGIMFGSGSSEHPIRFSWTSRNARWRGVYDYKKGKRIRMSVSKGTHTLKFSRRGPLPHLVAIRLDSPKAFPKDWKPPQRPVDLTRVPPRQRRAFLPPGAVNVAALRPAIQDTIERFGPQYPNGRRFLKQLADLEEKQKRAEEAGNQEALQKIHDALADLRRRALLAHPALKFDKLLFIKRPRHLYGHTYASQRAHKTGGNLCILSPLSPDGKVTKLVPELDGGLFDRFDLSFDATKVIFTYKEKGKHKAFRLYEVEIDPQAGKMVPGSLRQLTFGGEKETRAMQNHAADAKPRFHDMHPCYLPNGKIMFVSTRAQAHVFCAPGNTVTTLYLMDADGKNLRKISASPVNETAPSLMNDGRVVYNRWEYVDKGLGHNEGLWAIRPDGTGVDHIYKNNTLWPAGMGSARAIPGSRQIVAVAGNHYYPGVGPVMLVDTCRNRRTTQAMTCLTPELDFPLTYGYTRQTRRFGLFTDPYPFSEKFFLVSHRPPKAKGAKGEKGKPHYGIYALDAWGNRAALYRDPDFSCFEPMPLRPRPRPREVASVARTDEDKPATLFIQDVYQGMTGIERGKVKYVRVMGALPWPWDERGISWCLGLFGDPHRKKVYGVAKVHEDGSAYFTAPPGENLFFQALDENFMALQVMPTFINLMPGENRSCIGCHERRTRAPSLAPGQPLALDHPPQTLAPQPGDAGPRMVHYPTDVQDTLNEHCVKCHGSEDPKGRLDLTDVPTGKYNRAYENLIKRGLVSPAACRSGAANCRAAPPLTHGSHRSKLVEQIRRDPCQANLSREEFIKIITWVDANAPYYGTYRGKRDPKYKDDPDFRPPPLAAKK